MNQKRFVCLMQPPILIELGLGQLQGDNLNGSSPFGHPFTTYMGFSKLYEYGGRDFYFQNVGFNLNN